MQAFDAIGSRSDLAIMASSAEIMYLVHPDKIMREKAQAIIQEISKFATENLDNNPVLYAAIKKYVEQKSPAEKLSETQRYYIDELMKEFKRNGLELPEEKQAEVRALKNEITMIDLQFEANINNEGNKTIAVARQELQGVPEDFIDALKKQMPALILLQSIMQPTTGSWPLVLLKPRAKNYGLHLLIAHILPMKNF